MHVVVTDCVPINGDADGCDVGDCGMGVSTITRVQSSLVWLLLLRIVGRHETMKTVETINNTKPSTARIGIATDALPFALPPEPLTGVVIVEPDTH